GPVPVVPLARVGRGVRPGRAPDRALIVVHDLVEGVDTGDLAVPSRHGAGTVEFVGQDVVQDGVHERGFTRSRDSGDPHEASQRERRGDVLQVVLPRPAHGDPPVRIGLPPGGGYGNGATAGEV